MSTLTPAQATEAAPEWHYRDGELHLAVGFDDFAGALDFVNQVGAIAEEMNHHPNIVLRWGHVGLAVSSHDVGGITDRDVTFAERVVAVVASSGGEIQPSSEDDD